MQDAAAGRHPLHVAGAQHAVCTGVIAVLERAFEHEGHRLHAAMRMLLEAARRMEPVFAERQERRGAVPSFVADDALLLLHLARRAERHDARHARYRSRRHSSLIPAALTTWRQLASSPAIIVAYSCGVLPPGSRPSFASVSSTPGFTSALRTSAFTRS